MEEEHPGVIYVSAEEFAKLTEWLEEEPTEEEIEGVKRFIEEAGKIIDERGYL